MLWNAKNGCATVGRTSMYYVSFGRGEKPLILLPGLSDGLTAVKEKALFMAKPYKCFFEKYSVYMFSRKNDLPEEYSIREMAADQAKAMKALGIEKAFVVGVSQGGMIAQYLAIDFPDMVEKLVLAVSAPRVNDMLRDNIRYWIELTKCRDHKQLMIDMVEKSYSESRLTKCRKFYSILGRIGKPKAYQRFFVNANAILHFDAYQEIEKIKCPTFILCGAEDKIVGVRSSYEMNERIPNSRLYEYEGLGHGAYDEASDFYRRIFDFLEKD